LSTKLDAGREPSQSSPNEACTIWSPQRPEQLVSSTAQNALHDGVPS